MVALRRLAPVALASVAGPVLLFLACSNKDSATPPGPPPATSTFAPAACPYVVGHVTDFPDFEANADEVGAAATPVNVRVGLGGDTDASKPGYADPSKSFSVGWRTDVATKASKLRYGEAPDKLSTVVEGASYVLPQEFKAGPEEGLRFHEAHACGLQPGRTYYYQVGGGPAGKEAWSAVASLTTAPSRGSKDPLIFGLVGDTRDALGRTDLPVWKGLAGRVKVSGARFALFGGDYVLMGVDQNQWDIWLKGADSLSTSMFLAMAPGNHENETNRYFAHALMPGTGKNAERYASFDYGPVHVVMIDDYVGVVAPTIDVDGYKDELLAWLDADLAKADANRAAVPWVVTFHHHPVYDSGDKSDRVAERKATHDAFAARFDKYHVDLDFAGHDHFYERSKPVVADAVAAKGTTYLVDGAGGAPSYGTKPDNPLSDKIEHYDPDKMEGIYGLVTVDATTFSLEVRKMGASGATPKDDALVDSLKLTR